LVFEVLVKNLELVQPYFTTSIANPNIKDIANCTPIEYALEKQLNYYALLLSKAQGGKLGKNFTVRSIRVFLITIKLIKDTSVLLIINHKHQLLLEQQYM